MVIQESLDTRSNLSDNQDMTGTSATEKQLTFIASLCGEARFEQCWRKLQKLGWNSSACKRPTKAQASQMIDELQA